MNAQVNKEVLAQIASSVESVTRQVLDKPDFSAGLGREIAFQLRQMNPYPLVLERGELVEGSTVLVPPRRVTGHALILTMLPVRDIDPCVVLAIPKTVKVSPPAEEGMPQEEAADHEALDMIVYKDSPFDLSKRQLVQLTLDFETELHRQLLELHVEKPTFFYLTLLKLPELQKEANGQPAPVQEPSDGPTEEHPA